MAAEGTDFHTIVVRSVLPESPASASRMHRGDIIVAIDGKPASGYTLWQFEELLTKSGSTVALTLRRDDRSLVEYLALRSLV